MTDKWRWIFLIWHDWRAAVWAAEMCLYPQEHHAGGLISTPYRYRWAETMRDFHRARAQEMSRALFPPKPIDWDDLMALQGKLRAKRNQTFPSKEKP